MKYIATTFLIIVLIYGTDAYLDVLDRLKPQPLPEVTSMDIRVLKSPLTQGRELKRQLHGGRP